MSDNLYGQFTALTARAPGRALIGPDGAALSAADLDRLANQYAHALADLGAEPGQRVALKVEKSIPALAVYLACLKLGAIFLPMNPAYTVAETRYILDDAEPCLLIADPADETAAPCPVLTMDAAGAGPLAEAAAAKPDRFAAALVTPDTVATILYTSGTTGRPKGAMLSHHNLASNARTLAQAWHFSAADVLLHALPIFHAHGLFVAVNVALTVGCPMIFLPRFDVAEILRHLPQASAFMGVPTYYGRLLAEPSFNRQATAHMRLFVSGSAPLLPEAFAAFAARTGHRILERYGMTETSMICSNPYDGPRLPGSVGPALPGIAVRVASEDGVVLSPGEIGVLEVKGPNVLQGYWRKPEASRDSFRADGWFMTGDLARIDDAGYVHLIGRAKDLIISGGLNVYPLEIEDALNALPEVAESAVIGLPHRDFGEAVTAIVVPAAGHAVDESAMQQKLQAQLAGFKRPKRILSLDALPRNTMGKVEKAKLRRDFAQLYGEDAGIRA
ncbi:MAG: malonyl-CoA synthase [Sphingomonadales bacterium]